MTWILAWNQLNFEVYYLFLAQFWQILAISSLKLPKNFKFFKNWARNELYNSKESWDHLKIDFMAKKYDLFEKKTKKTNFLIFWLKIGRIRYLRRPISQNFQKKNKNLTSPVNIKCFNLKNHQQLKKKFYPQKNGVRFTLVGGKKSPPPRSEKGNCKSRMKLWKDRS